MTSLNELQLESNSKIKLNFKGGDLSSDSGLLLIKEFAHKIGLNNLIKKNFQTNDTAKERFHTDYENLCQSIYQILAGYFNDNDADELTNEPIFKRILEKSSLASQPTLSRFFNRMDEDTLKQFNEICKKLRALVYKIESPEMVLLDLDSTLLNTYGKQEGEGFNFHYSDNGYHPLLCYDGLNGDLLKAELRDGTVYTSNGVVEFMQPLLDEYLQDYDNIDLFLRGDSGFATPDLFRQCECNGVSYAIRLKANQNLYKLASYAEYKITELSENNSVDYAVVYDEFYYQAGSWDYPRRVVVKVEKPADQLTYQYTFIVTNMNMTPKETFKYYCNRGTMENFIKECKTGFNFASTPSRSKIVNANRLQLHVLVYNLFNYFRRIVLPESMRKMQVDTIRLKLIKIASKVIKSARYIYFKLCSSCPYQKEFYAVLENIRSLPQLE
jgi:hypothetical protein